MKYKTEYITLKEYIDTLQKILDEHGDMPMGRLYAKAFGFEDYCEMVSSPPQYIDKEVDTYYKGKPFVNIVTDEELC